MVRRVLKLVFQDHASGDDVSLAEIQQAKPVVTVVYGEVVKDTDSYLTILTSYEKSKLPQSSAKGCAWTILKSTILEIVELTPKC